MAITKEIISGTKIINEVKSSNVKKTEYDLETNTHKLVRNVFTLQDMTIPFENPKVISFTVGDDNTSKPMTSVLREDDDDYDEMEYMDYMDNV